MSTSISDDLLTGIGAGVGAGAWVAGVILTIIIGFAGLNASIQVIVENAILDGTLSVYTLMHSWFYDAGTSTGLEVYTILPIILLVGAGYYVASQEGTGYMAAAGITAGYFVLALLSIIIIFLMASRSPDLVDTIVRLIIAGVVFPAIFAGIGGAIADAM